MEERQYICKSIPLEERVLIRPSASAFWARASRLVLPPIRKLRPTNASSLPPKKKSRLPGLPRLLCHRLSTPLLTCSLPFLCFVLLFGSSFAVVCSLRPPCLCIISDCFGSCCWAAALLRHCVPPPHRYCEVACYPSPYPPSLSTCASFISAASLSRVCPSARRRREPSFLFPSWVSLLL